MPTHEEAKEKQRLEAIWREVERQLAAPVPKEARTYLSELHEAELSLRERKSAAELLCIEFNRLQAHGLLAGRRQGQQTKASVEIPDGGRWQLLYDLGRHFECKYRGLPIADEFHGFDPLLLEYDEDTLSYPLSHRIRVDFDSGMNLATVFAILQREFRQRYRPQGWVRTTRPLGERALALVRFVCLDSQEGLTWRQRLSLWNERFPRWQFTDARRLQAAFRRAELQLTGSRGGLSILYITLEEYRQRDRKWRESQLARLRAEGHLHEQMLEKGGQA